MSNRKRLREQVEQPCDESSDDEKLDDDLNGRLQQLQKKMSNRKRLREQVEKPCDEPNDDEAMHQMERCEKVRTCRYIHHH